MGKRHTIAARERTFYQACEVSSGTVPMVGASRWCHTASEALRQVGSLEMKHDWYLDAIDSQEDFLDGMSTLNCAAVIGPHGTTGNWVGLLVDRFCELPIANILSACQRLDYSLPYETDYLIRVARRRCEQDDGDRLVIAPEVMYGLNEFLEQAYSAYRSLMA